MNLSKGDTIISADVRHPDDKKGECLVLGENGIGKKTPLDEYKTQNRGGSGIKCAKVTEKTGKLIVARVVRGEESELITKKKKGQVIRTDADSIPSLGRDTQGVTIMKLRPGDGIASVAFL